MKITDAYTLSLLLGEVKVGTCEPYQFDQAPLGVVQQVLTTMGTVSSLENLDYGRRDLSRWPRGTLYPQKLAITSLTSGGRSVGIVRSRTQTTEFSLVLV
jgi:hypothetical protein